MYRIREIYSDDDYKGYGLLLSQLSTANVTHDSWKRFMKSVRENPNHYLFVVEKMTPKSELVGTGTLLVEPKLLHGGLSVGHIEDIVIDQQHRKKGLFRLLMESLINCAKANNCYKVILDCSSELEPVYQSVGFTMNNIGMSIYFTS